MYIHCMYVHIYIYTEAQYIKLPPARLPPARPSPARPPARLASCEICRSSIYMILFSFNIYRVLYINCIALAIDPFLG